MSRNTLRGELHDAAARRALIVDRYQMGDKQAECMACRARGIIAGLGLGLALVYTITRPRFGGRR